MNFVRRGHPVRAVSRSGDARRPPGEGWFEAQAADATSVTALDRAVGGAAVVVHAAQPAYTRWLQEFPALTERVADAAERADARLVLVDNLYAYGAVDGGYGPDTSAGPLTEETPQRATDRKGNLRRAMARALLARHEQGRQPVAVGRFSDYYGPGAGASVASTVLEAATRGRRARWLLRRDQPHTLHFLPDAARGFATLVEHSDADGGVWHLPAAPPLTGGAFLDLVAEATGAPTGVVSGWQLALAARFVPAIRETAEVAYQFDRPFVVDASRFERTFGEIVTTPHKVAVEQTVAALRGEPSAVAS